jgi:hypothetical protein
MTLAPSAEQIKDALVALRDMKLLYGEAVNISNKLLDHLQKNNRGTNTKLALAASIPAALAVAGIMLLFGGPLAAVASFTTLSKGAMLASGGAVAVSGVGIGGVGIKSFREGGQLENCKLHK